MAARMRTIKQTVQTLKEQDPGSAITEWFLRGLVKSGRLKCHKAGNRALIDLDALEEFLKTPPVVGEVKKQTGTIRRIQ